MGTLSVICWRRLHGTKVHLLANEYALTLIKRGYTVRILPLCKRIFLPEPMSAEDVR
jgi:hypothetical protein